eukprot:15439247-Alexandrium_andersonii.AAC.1
MARAAAPVRAQRCVFPSLARRPLQVAKMPHCRRTSRRAWTCNDILASAPHPVPILRIRVATEVHGAGAASSRK